LGSHLVAHGLRRRISALQLLDAIEDLATRTTPDDTVA
jgi:hypothetical protein